MSASMLLHKPSLESFFIEALSTLEILTKILIFDFSVDSFKISYFFQVLVVHYENLKSDLKSELRKILGHLNLPVVEER